LARPQHWRRWNTLICFLGKAIVFLAGCNDSIRRHFLEDHLVCNLESLEVDWFRLDGMPLEGQLDKMRPLVGQTPCGPS
jgi:hypothetical protein